MWFNNNKKHLRKCLFAVPNGGARSALQGKIFKMTGVVAGVSDMIFLYRGFAILIEMKTPIGSQSDDQKDWERIMTENYFKYYICRDLETFKEIIEDTINIIDKTHSKYSFLQLIYKFLGLNIKRY